MDEQTMTLKIVRAVQTCFACPSQWDAWTDTGQYLYLRYRHGWGAVWAHESDDYRSWEPGQAPVAEFEEGGEFDGVIELEEFCRLAGIELELSE